MERVRKICFDPLLTTKEQIQQRLNSLPLGTAHPFSPERILLCKVGNDIHEIDISAYPEDYFLHGVDLGQMGEVLLGRMAKFPNHLSFFNDYQVAQAPASTFRVPISSNKIAVLAVSTRDPTYWDFCFADSQCNTCCWVAQTTFPGISHSGDILGGADLLDYVTFNEASLTDKEICVFISGYRVTQIHRFQGTHPALLVADHEQKTLYIIPVPLDAATIGDATICCPVVFKRDGDSVVFSILPKATVDTGKMCNSSRLESTAFQEAISRADFTITTSASAVTQATMKSAEDHDTLKPSASAGSYDNAVFMTDATTTPPHLAMQNFQVIKFGTGLDFTTSGQTLMISKEAKSTVLPCIWGTELQGPMLLANGSCPANVPFSNADALLSYYKQLKSVVFVLNDSMTDNARNLASSFRMNAVFVVQPQSAPQSEKHGDIVQYLDSVNINGVTALAGPQSLVLVHMADKFYYYRGIANRAHMNASQLEFGSDVTPIVRSAGLAALLEPVAQRIYNLDDTSNSIILPVSKQFVTPKDLQQLFSTASVSQIESMEEDICAAVSQLQSLLNERDLLVLSYSLVEVLAAKTADATQAARTAYMDFLRANWNSKDSASLNQKANLRGELKKLTKQVQVSLEPAISKLSAMISSRTTSKRTHDLKRLQRQSKIQDNVQAAKEMTFENLAGLLEDYASDMGVMVLNIETGPFTQLLSTLTSGLLDAQRCCALDSRILYLEGLDAGIIMEQSQASHNGPLQNQSGPLVPIMSMPYLNQGAGTGSMLAWVCWDEFVNLESPFTIRWMEKCNEAHISALRIIMRATLSTAIISREYNISAGAPETGQLMVALLMASMAKLAETRQSVPVEVTQAEDTVTKLMRGLFGNLLTVAGSGVRPLSMVWQLFGHEPNFDIPDNYQQWLWYQNVVSLYPYSGWPSAQFDSNLQHLLDKMIVRVVAKGEDIAGSRRDRIAEMARFCRLRNIQLDHCRTIITVLVRLLTEDVDKAACASRLLAHLPEHLERQTRSYTKLRQYLLHLSNGGERRQADDAVAANVYTRRSAAFSAVKTQVAELCKGDDWQAIKDGCQELKKLQKSIAEKWNLPPSAVKVQVMEIYEKLLESQAPTEDMEQQQRTKLHELTRQVLGDAECSRVPWQVGKHGQFDNDIEPLDEAFVEEMLTGKRPEHTAVAACPQTVKQVALERKEEVSFEKYKKLLREDFKQDMEKEMTPEHVCAMMHIPVEAMQVFAKALNPDFVWEDLGPNFRAVILGLLENRSGRIESRPVRRLLKLD